MIELSDYEAGLVQMQIQREMQASINYLHLYNLVNSQKVHYPKIASYFKKESENEKEHAIILMDYLNSRGIIPLAYSTTQCTVRIDDTISEADISNKNWYFVVRCFEFALEMEKNITTEILHIYNNVSDVSLQLLLEEFITEQYKSLDSLIRHLNSIKNFNCRHSLLEYSEML